MANYSKKVMGKEVGDAKVYAPPHTMKGKTISAKGLTSKGMTGAEEMATMDISVGGISKFKGKPVLVNIILILRRCRLKARL